MNSIYFSDIKHFISKRLNKLSEFLSDLEIEFLNKSNKLARRLSILEVLNALNFLLLLLLIFKK